MTSYSFPDLKFPSWIVMNSLRLNAVIGGTKIIGSEELKPISKTNSEALL